MEGADSAEISVGPELDGSRLNYMEVVVLGKPATRRRGKVLCHLFYFECK